MLGNTILCGSPLVFVSNPWKASWADTAPFRGPQLASCVASVTKKIFGRAGLPWTPLSDSPASSASPPSTCSLPLLLLFRKWHRPPFFVPFLSILLFKRRWLYSLSNSWPLLLWVLEKKVSHLEEYIADNGLFGLEKGSTISALVDSFMPRVKVTLIWAFKC